MTNKEKLIGNSSLDMAGWIFRAFTFCEECPAHSSCAIKDTEERCYEPNCVKEIVRWLDSEVEEK